jgi:RNA polymerase sigma-70 factor, ECF subfamily
VDELSRLLVAARDGSVGDFADFMRATQAEIWRFCLGVVGPDEVDDVTQEVFVAAWRSLAYFRGDASARTWLFVIARRTARRAAQRRRNRPISPDSPASLDPGHPRHFEMSLQIKDELLALEPERREAFILTQMLGFSYAQAAEVCECPVGTIRSRVARARQDLVTLHFGSGAEARDPHAHRDLGA